MRVLFVVSLSLAFLAGLDAEGQHGSKCGPNVPEKCDRGLRCAGTICLADGSVDGKWGYFCGTKGAYNCGKGLKCKLKDESARDIGGKCIADGTVLGGSGFRCDSDGGYKCKPNYDCVRDKKHPQPKICVKSKNPGGSTPAIGKFGGPCSKIALPPCNKGLECISDTCWPDGSVPGEVGQRCGSRRAYVCKSGLHCKLDIPGTMDLGGVCVKKEE